MKISSLIVFIFSLALVVILTSNIANSRNNLNHKISEVQQLSSNKHLDKNKNIKATSHLKTIVLGAGCFWGAEKRYQAIPGVVDAISGYAGGENVNANYRDVSSYYNKENKKNHAEVVKVIYNDNITNITKILENFFEGHDPTQLNRQGNDIGTQYRSIILTTSEKQFKTAFNLRALYQQLLTKAGYGIIKTEIKPLIKFYPAEEYHQNYLMKHPNGYCPDHSTGVTFKVDDKVTKLVSNKLLQHGKHILIIDSEHYCPYCEKLRKETLINYQGSIPISYRHANQLQGLKINSPTWATPTIIFLKDGKEVFGHQGFMNKTSFYKLLGKFKLGKSEAFNVAFKQGTDMPYCEQYKIFQNTADGFFLDKLSGAKLFDTRDRFNSKSGWLSFTKAVEGAVYQKEDFSYDMERTEILSSSSHIHLGHVFPDGPDGKPRYCINATVLEYVPRAKL